MSKRFAFTLAEVLITLGIIGVVAAMTIPTLVADYNKKVWDTSAAVFEKKLEAALKTMNTQMTLLGHDSTASFVEELSKHFKMNKICQNDELLDCFPNEVYWGSGDAEPELVDMSEIKVAKDFGQTSWDTELIGVLFANGISALIAYNPTEACVQDPYSNQISGSNCLAILYDTSAFKSPNTGTKDLRGNQFVTKLGKFCALELNGQCYGAAFKAAPYTWKSCSNGVASDPEEIALMEKYGIELCISDRLEGSTDYWAGAVIACGGIEHMLTQDEGRAIKSYLYNGSYLNLDKVEALGITLRHPYYSSTLCEESSASIWTNELPYSTQASQVQFYYRSKSSSASGYRYFDSPYTICK